MKIASRIADIPMSGIRKMLDLAGSDSVNLGLGEPDLAPPAEAIRGMNEAASSGKNKYGPTAGIPELRNAVAEYFSKYGRIEGSNVMITPSGSTGLLEVTQSMIDPGDRAIVPDPGFVIYKPHAELAGAEAVGYKLTDDGLFQPDIDDIQSKITPNTSMIVVNTPSNPTGGVLTEESKRALCDIARDKGITILSDEVYSEFIYEGKHTSIASFPGMFDNTIIVSGLSKTYAMTGWRLGWAIAPEPMIKDLNKLQSHSISCCVSFVQEAAVEALTGPQDAKDSMVREFRKRRDLALDLIDEIPGLECNVPKGAFYVFPKYDVDMPSAKLAEILLKEGHVAVTPGTAFGPGGEGFFRVSYATSEDLIREGFDRIKKTLSQL